MSVFFKYQLNFIFWTITCLFCLSCAPDRKEELPQEPLGSVPVIFEHQVRYSGETLVRIANWYTGKSKNWKLVADANPDLNPKRMKIGSKIIIPQELLIRKDPLPKSAIVRAKASKTKKIERTKAGSKKNSGSKATAKAADSSKKKKQQSSGNSNQNVHDLSTENKSDTLKQELLRELEAEVD